MLIDSSIHKISLNSTGFKGNQKTRKDLMPLIENDSLEINNIEKNQKPVTRKTTPMASVIATLSALSLLLSACGISNNNENYIDTTNHIDVEEFNNSAFDGFVFEDYTFDGITPQANFSAKHPDKAFYPGVWTEIITTPRRFYVTPDGVRGILSDNGVEHVFENEDTFANWWDMIKENPEARLLYDKDTNCFVLVNRDNGDHIAKMP